MWLALLLSLVGVAAAKLQSVHARGNKFFYDNDTQFFAKGISYQERVRSEGAVNYVSRLPDMLADARGCARDVPYLKELGVNAIRVYAIDELADHDACMKLLDEAGIYVFADLSKASSRIQSSKPTWEVDVHDLVMRRAEAMAKYPNVAGLIVGNTVTVSPNTTSAMAYVKAAVRDVKVHLKKKGLRRVSVGYDTNDLGLVRSPAMQYLNCGGDDLAMTDFWGVHNFGWCGSMTRVTSGWEDMAVFYNKTTVPVLLTEYGCGTPYDHEAREFRDTEALYSDMMVRLGQFSGGFAYTYLDSPEGLGLVQIDSGDSVTKLDDFDRLRRALRRSNPAPATYDSKRDVRRQWPCPKTSHAWRAHAVLPPTPDDALCKCLAAAGECEAAVIRDDYGRNPLVAIFCDQEPTMCTGALSDPVRGYHGAFSMCGERDRINHQINGYFQRWRMMGVEKGELDACYWKGAAGRKLDTSGNECSEPLRLARLRNEELVKRMTADGALDGKSDLSKSTIGPWGTYPKPPQPSVIEKIIKWFHDKMPGGPGSYHFKKVPADKLQ